MNTSDIEMFNKLSPYQKVQKALSYSDDKSKLELLNTPEFIDGLNSYDIKDIVMSLSSKEKINFLNNLEFIKSSHLESYEIEEIILTLDDDSKKTLLLNQELIKQSFGLTETEITRLIKSLSSEQDKLETIPLYNLTSYSIADIVETFKDSSKSKILINNEYNLDKSSILQIIISMSIDNSISFIKNNRDFLLENSITTSNIVMLLSPEDQLEFFKNIETMGFSFSEKMLALVSFNKEVKDEIKKSNPPQEYVDALNLHPDTNSATYGRIIPELDGRMERYRGLDEIIHVNGLNIKEEERENFIKLLEICPNIKIKDNLLISSSSSQEYINAEKWISSVLDGIDPNWSDIQKVAYVDNAIGKKISYSPDFDTEVFDAGNARSLWKIIDSGYGVCNGIAQVEKYILDRLGIKSEIVSGKSHSFLKLINIEIPTEDGKLPAGNTILDPTWNLAAHRFGFIPQDFCVSYEEIRKHDIQEDGQDRKCHFNESLEDATLSLDIEALRKIYSSIGIANKDGSFPGAKLVDGSDKIISLDISTEEKLKLQLELLESYCPDFSRCINSTSSILQLVLLKKIDFNKCVVKRVYERTDESKSPVLYVFVDLPNSGKKFFIADKTTSKFVEYTQKEFEEKYECYDKDLEKQNGIRPWESGENVKSEDDLTHSSGKVIANEGGER